MFDFNLNQFVLVFKSTVKIWVKLNISNLVKNYPVLQVLSTLDFELWLWTWIVTIFFISFYFFFCSLQAYNSFKLGFRFMLFSWIKSFAICLVPISQQQFVLLRKLLILKFTRYWDEGRWWCSSATSSDKWILFYTL